MKKCILCNSEKVEEFKAEPVLFLEKRMFKRKIEDGTLIHCKDCGFLYSSFRPTEEESARYYKEYFTGEYNKERAECEPELANTINEFAELLYGEKSINRRKIIMKELFEKHFLLENISNVLDFGGSNGKLILNEFTKAKKFVYDIQDVEPVQGVEKIDFDKLDSQNWDFIMCNHVLEHLANPIEEINLLKKIMHEGSYLYIEVPYEAFDCKDCSNKIFQIHEHINFFTPKTFKTLFDSSEYTILENKAIKHPELKVYPPVIHFLVKKEAFQDKKNLLETNFSKIQDSILKEKLQIVLITYNRIEYLKETLDKILAKTSPIKDFDIVVLDNASFDGTSEMLEDYALKYPNIKYFRHNINIGGCANIARAFSDYLTKDYVWVLCDNDDYCWKSWNEVEMAVEQNFDMIMTRECKNTPTEILYHASLVSGAIYKTSNITDTIIENLYYEIANMFPHLAFAIKNVNDNKKIYIVQNDIVRIGINPEHNTSMVRGLNTEDLCDNRKNIFWSVGYFNTLELIKNKNLRYEIIENTRHFHKSLFELFKTIMIKNKVFYKNYFNNLVRIYKMLNLSQKIRFIFAYLVINLSFKDYTFSEMRSGDEWIEYLQKVGEQNFINKLAKKYKNKKIILYGAGLVAKILVKNFDLSKFNIVGIADRRFETSGEQEFLGYKTIKPTELNSIDCEVILFTMKLFKQIEKTLKEKGLKAKMSTIIKTSHKYFVRT